MRIERLDIPTRQIVITHFPLKELEESEEKFHKEEYIPVKEAMETFKKSSATIREWAYSEKIKSRREIVVTSMGKREILLVNKSDVINHIKTAIKYSTKVNPRVDSERYSEVSDPLDKLGGKVWKIIKLSKEGYSYDVIIEKLKIKDCLKEYVKLYCARLKKTYGKGGSEERARNFQYLLYI